MEDGSAPLETEGKYSVAISGLYDPMLLRRLSFKPSLSPAAERSHPGQGSPSFLMTAVVRPTHLWLGSVVLFQFITFTLAAPPFIPHRRTNPIVSHSPNGPGTDGSGSVFSLPAVIWIIFSLVIGLPLAVSGIRGWRCTTAASIALGSMVCSWAGIINSVNEVGISDILLTFIVLVFGLLGLVIGLFEFSRVASMAVISIMGGLALGMKVVLVKKDLLITSSFILNWIIVVVFGVGMGLMLIWRPRAAMVISCASVGTFLSVLGIDLLLNKQSGLSLGLRHLFDQNDNHFAYFIDNPYDPNLTTRILQFVSIGLTPILALAQHLIFKEPFVRKPPPPSDDELCLNYPTEDNSANRATSFLSGIWDGTRFRAGRFSL
ncbi:hypothetical protein D9757_006165 [Collybiopsis confluens]|uniref:TM7S3/TM198-like domain-containing protein n=1 Tax=Collybiopsis confluens TaxID=2823264 RepID=A0A8H5HHF7_9AGAR|nr:hypothetical protein D9757_006165 [Collybiopsis confluens]